MDIVVVGAGLAGLVAATTLARAGRRVTVIERARQPGGRAVTTVESEYRFNLGPHALYAGGAMARALAGLGVRWSGHDPGAEGQVLWRGGLAPLPGGPWSFLTTSLLEGGRMEAAGLIRRLLLDDVAALRHTTVAEWLAPVRDPGARGLGEALIRVSSYCDDPTRMSAGLAIAQARSALRHGVRYLDGGWGTIVEGLVAAATAAGVRFETGDVEAVRPGGVRVGEWRDTRAILLAVPLAAARRLVDVPAAPPVRAACLDVALSPGVRVVHRFILGVDRPLYLVNHAATARLAPPGGALFHAMHYLGPDGEADVAELEDLVDRAAPGWREHVVHRRFLPGLLAASAVPLAEGRRPDVAVGEGIWAAGDWVGEEGLLADASAASALRAAAEILRCTS